MLLYGIICVILMKPIPSKGPVDFFVIENSLKWFVVEETIIRVNLRRHGQ